MVLVRAAQGGDAAAVACLIERVEPALHRFSVRLAGEAGADDLTQEVLLRACRALGSLEQPARFEAWLFAIAANLARRWWRQQLRWPISLEGLAAAYPDLPAPAWTSAWTSLTPPEASPDVVFEEAEQSKALQAALDSLPAPLGRVVALHYLDGLDYREVAAALDVPVSTVKGRLFKSRRRLQKELLAAGFPQARQPRQAQQPRQPRQPRAGDASLPQSQKGVPAMAAPKRTAPDGPAASDAPTEEEVLVDSLRMNALAPNRVVFLKSKARERFLPIIVGVPEADAMAIALQKKQVPRPLTHDLMLSGFGALGASVTRVVVSRLEGETFLAQVHLNVGGRHEVLDARPSDSFALAVRAGAPIFVAEEVMERAGIESVQQTESGAYQVPSALQPTERMQKVLTLAHEEMARFGRDRIGEEHALLGILAEGSSVAARALFATGVQLTAARAAVAAVSGFGDSAAPKTVPAEPANPNLRDLVVEEASRLGNKWVGTEHLLFALLRGDDGVASTILRQLGVAPDAVRQQLTDALKELEQTSAKYREAEQTG